MVKQSPKQKRTVGRVMHEFKHGELTRGRGGKVKSPKQAIAIALHEAGASKYESPSKNRQNLRKTKSKERRGETGQAEGKKRSRNNSRSGTGQTRAELYAQAKRKHIRGRSKMSKAELARAVRG